MMVPLTAHNLPAEFFWSDTWEYRLMKDGTPLHELTLYAFRRLFWLDTVSLILTAAQFVFSAPRSGRSTSWASSRRRRSRGRAS